MDNRGIKVSPIQEETLRDLGCSYLYESNPDIENTVFVVINHSNKVNFLKKYFYTEEAFNTWLNFAHLWKA